MNNKEETTGLPADYERLKAAANRTSSWRERLAAVEELGRWKQKKTIDVLTHRMNNDTVFQVREAAFRKLEQLGEAVEAPTRKAGDLIDGLTKTLVRIKKSLPKDHSIDAFKEKLHKMRLDIYDAYEGEMGADFDKWLTDKWQSLSIR
ncbi:HEAT repeat domain-containing protein [Cohnella sp. GCM10027633]|uniref:HEAT repeat domain-containing protein n=1 Tax=unclassified Cohnella TaxID=2636738 RepID=UPI003640414C